MAHVPPMKGDGRGRYSSWCQDRGVSVEGITRPSSVGTADLAAFLIATGLIAIHVVSDNFLQPEPGTSAADHLVSGLVPLACLLVAAVAYPRLKPGLRAILCAVVGLFGITGRRRRLVLRDTGWPFEG